MEPTTMQVGIVTPVVTRLPRAHAAWEREAGIDEVARIVVEAERLGYHHVTCSEHVAIPADVAATRGATYWDPLPTFGYLAAPTSVIRFATFVLVLGYHHPLELVKRYGTLDNISGGRLILGVGVGSLEPEFTLLDAEFADRGARADEALRAIRASWGRPVPEHHGTHYDFAGMVVDPLATRTTVPIWIGGRTARSLRRAVELGDAWAPFGLDAAEIGILLDRARATETWAQRSVPLDVALQPDALDPLVDPDGTRAAVARLRAAGATILNLRFVHHSAEHYCEQLAAMQDLLGS
jgi:probable F420-dependent oxidoreductase